ncbi:hypothetical protein VHEMI02153 [[Torrubiella] hemipterigena]|uniref:Copper acquisition factor BIM1-like domain-containing protein n=1 Tax=[Torrubiella] hemipterigena TaxID=1531966 RepID=A0A0A1T715_9HYPO|nr:hypothetical protein VHEMI02153 [[Torrubiella] hemipterigena]
MASVTLLLAWCISISLASAAHAGFHVQFPWMTRRPNPKTRPAITQYNPFCGQILRNPQPYARSSRSFLSFSGHPGDLVTVLYTRHRVPRRRDDFSQTILQAVPIQPSGQLCVNVTIPFQTEINEMGVLYLEATNPKTGDVEYHCSDIEFVDLGQEALPEDHPAMCAANNETIIPMPDEYM